MDDDLDLDAMLADLADDLGGLADAYGSGDVSKDTSFVIKSTPAPVAAVALPPPPAAAVALPPPPVADAALPPQPVASAGLPPPVTPRAGAPPPVAPRVGAASPVAPRAGLPPPVTPRNAPATDLPLPPPVDVDLALPPPPVDSGLPPPSAFAKLPPPPVVVQPPPSANGSAANSPLLTRPSPSPSAAPVPLPGVVSSGGSIPPANTLCITCWKGIGKMNQFQQAWYHEGCGLTCPWCVKPIEKGMPTKLVDGFPLHQDCYNKDKKAAAAAKEKKEAERWLKHVEHEPGKPKKVALAPNATESAYQEYMKAKFKREEWENACIVRSRKLRREHTEAGGRWLIYGGTYAGFKS